MSFRLTEDRRALPLRDALAPVQERLPLGKPPAGFQKTNIASALVARRVNHRG